MAALVAPDGKSFRLDVVGYEYPPGADAAHRSDSPDWDLNWLIVCVDVDDGVRQWHATDPALTTWEVRALIGWLRTDALLLPSASHDRFVETCLSGVSTHREDKGVKFSVSFDHEFTPKDAEPVEPVTVVLDVDDESILQFAADLEHQLERFPER